MTISEKANAVKLIKSQIKQAIIDKGVSVDSNAPFSTYPEKIGEITSGSEPTLETLTVVPSTTSQTLTPPSGVDGFDEVSVSAVTAAIDSDIQAGNIKSGVEILGVTGTYTGEGANLQSKTLTVDSTTPTVSTVAPDSGYDGLSSVTVDMTYVEDRLDTLLGTSVVPTGTLSITANGVYDVTNYASANVSVASGANTALLTVKIEFDEAFLEGSSSLRMLRSITFSINGTTYTYRDFYLVKIYPYYNDDDYVGSAHMLLFIQVPMNTDLQWQATVVPTGDEEEFHPNDSGVLNISNDYTLNLELY